MNMLLKPRTMGALAVEGPNDWPESGTDVRARRRKVKRRERAQWRSEAYADAA